MTHLGSINELIGKALGDGLDVPESSLTSPSAQQPDGLDKTGKALASKGPSCQCPGTHLNKYQPLTHYTRELIPYHIADQKAEKTWAN